MESKDLQHLTLRLLGYYNEDNQAMNPEKEFSELDQELAELLSKTFEKIKNEKKAEELKLAIDNGVFIMKDTKHNLYAYLHKKKLARVTNVEFNRECLTQLPQKYKNWFVPGDELIIDESTTAFDPTPQLFFYEYLKSIGSINHQVELSVDYLEKKIISGELTAVGKNFIRLKDKGNQDLIISDHMMLCLDPVKIVQQEVEEDDPFIPALGIITNYDHKKRFGNVRKYGDNTTLGLREKELIDPKILKSPVGKKVVFSEREEIHPNGTRIYATFVHESANASKMLQLAEKIFNTNWEASKAVLEHILASDPEYEMALLKWDEMNSLDSQKIDEYTIKYKQAKDQLNNDKEDITIVESAIHKLKDVLDNGKKVKDTISLLAQGYYRRYELETDDKEIKAIYRKELIDHVGKYHSMLGPAASQNMRLKYYGLLDDKAYMETIDTILQEPEIKNSSRARMYYYKALYYHNHEDAVRAKSFAEESLFLRPFGNNAEKILIPNLKEPTLPKNSYLTKCLLATYLLAGDNYNDIEIEEDIDYSQKIELIAKSAPKYNDYLLWAAIDSNEIDENRAFAFLTEYIASQALVFAHDTKPSSALYYWSELFSRILPGFGYYSRVRFAEFLAYILNIDITKDRQVETYRPWENRKLWDEILTSNSTIMEDQWHRIFCAIGNNQAICQAVSQKIIDDVNLKASFAQYAGVKTDQLSIETIANTIDERKTQFIQHEINAIQEINELLKNSKTPEDLCTALDQISPKRQPFKALSQRNKALLKHLIEECLPLLKQCNVTVEHIALNSAKSELNFSLKELYKNIWQEPTFFSVRAIWHIIKKIEQDFKITSAEPEVKLAITKNNVIKDHYGNYEVEGEVAIPEYEQDAKDVKLSLVKKGIFKRFRYDPYPVRNIGDVRSGSTVPFSFLVKLDDDYNKPSFAFEVRCRYRVQNTTKSITSTFEIHIGNERPFVPITNNPYTYGSDLRIDDPTFVGRKKDIKELVNKVLHPQRAASQVILYGQKRCGKTSLVKAVIENLKNEHPDQAWCVFMTLTIDGKKELFSDRDFYRIILTNIRQDLGTYPEPKPTLNMPKEQQMKEVESPTQLFCDTIMELKQSMAITPGWEHKRLVLILDEFTLLYNSIKEGIASENILHNWKAIQESDKTNFVTIFVGHDISDTFLDEPYAVNAAAIIERYRLTYLKRDEAIELIKRPTNIDGSSRFETKAINLILDYTGCSPYFLQMFMKRMVEYINSKELATVTDHDVLMVAQNFISKQYSEMSSKSFDSLINCGLKDKYGKYKDKDIEKVLRAISEHSDSQSPHWCKESEVKNALTWKKDNISKKNVEDIIKDLESRKVIKIDKDANDNRKHVIRINVGIFREWLLKN